MNFDLWIDSKNSDGTLRTNDVESESQSLIDRYMRLADRALGDAGLKPSKE